jgi:uncharacterized membrane protein
MKPKGLSEEKTLVTPVAFFLSCHNIIILYVVIIVTSSKATRLKLQSKHRLGVDGKAGALQLKM